MSNTTIAITPTTDAKAGEEISVAVSINTDSPSSILAFDLSFSFDPEQLEPLSDSDLSELFSVAASAGSLTTSWGAPVVNAGVGSLTTSQASATPLTSGAGEILVLNFRIKDDASGPIAINLIENNSSIMEGSVQFSANDGSIVLATDEPNEINLSSTSFDENITAGSTVATLRSTDPDSGDSFTYALVAGTGDDDNAAFSIDGDQLKINASPDFETKKSYLIRVKTEGRGGLSLETPFILGVNDISNETIRASKTRNLRGNELNLILTGSSSINGTGNALNNSLTGNKAANTLNGQNGNDRLYGAGGNDVLNGGRGRDTAIFSSRANRVNLNSTKSQNTGDGRDRLISIENVDAGSGNDIITGNKAANTLNGQNGDDRLYGAGGNDVLNGGGGKDRVWGQAGRDTFRISKGAGYTIIEDFTDKQDRIHLASGRSGLRMVERDDDIYLYLRNDLMAIVVDAADQLQTAGNYLV